MDVDDIDAHRRTVRVIGKGSKERIVPFGGPAASAVDAYLVRGRPVLAARGQGSRAVFLGARGGRLGTRAAYDLLHGDVAGAFARNPAVPVLLVLTVVGLGVRVWRRRSGREVRPVSVWVPVAIALALLVFGILRNLPGWDFLSPA